MYLPTSWLRKVSRRLIYWFAVPIWLGLQACANSTPPPSEPASTLWGSQWYLQSIGKQPVMPGSKAALYFWEESRIAGNGSCNRFFGSASLSKDRISFGPLGNTKMACPAEVMVQEHLYLDALQKAQRFDRQGDTLLIYSQGAAQPLRFQIAE